VAAPFAAGGLTAPAPLPSASTVTATATAADSACVLFAASNGSDSASGTETSPFRSLRKLVSSLRAGQIGCLQSGQTFDSAGNLAIEAKEAHGESSQPVTITSTNPAEPATITHSLALEPNVNDLLFTHLSFSWSAPKPWGCWSAAGDPITDKVISGPGSCTTGTPAKEDSVQIVVDGKADAFTYDDITNSDTSICLLTSSTAYEALFENDRVHNCGPTVEAAQNGFPTLNEEPGWHSHGIYDFGHGTIIRNDYIYDNSRAGVLLYGGGSGAVVEHNILDHNGTGVWFGDDTDDRVAWNIVTNSTSPREQLDYGIGAFEAGSGDVASNNCLDGNLSGEVDAVGFTSTDNLTQANPLYANPQQNEYALQASSPCIGYGPASAQPQ
jgi:hypothetical protein